MIDLARERRLRELAELARDNPRVGAHLEERMAEEIAVRLTQELAERAGALVPLLADDPRLREWGRVSRASVVRLALDLGLRQLEAEEPPAPATGDLEEFARRLAPWISAELQEADRLARRITGATGVEVALLGRRGSGPPWIVRTAEGEVVGEGATAGEAAQAAMERLRRSTHA